VVRKHPWNIAVFQKEILFGKFKQHKELSEFMSVGKRISSQLERRGSFVLDFDANALDEDLINYKTGCNTLITPTP
jgi:hypothetical protein